ncbi:MAG: hypothetical protein ABW184_07215 [Sphingobium sp.]
MLRALVFAGIAAVAGRQLYKSGAVDRFGADLKRRTDELKDFADKKRSEFKTAEFAKAGGRQPLPRSAPVPPVA